MADLPLLRDPDAVELTGTVERVIFHNEENGYTVLRLLPDKGLTGEAKVTGAPPRTVSRDPVSCVGHMVDPQAGVQLKVAGRWVNNVRFGRQVEFNTAEEVLPATSEGIRLYLASGLIKGVGEELAGRIVEAFGTDTIRVLDEEPERLLKVRGLGRKSLGRIRDSWAEHRGMRDLLLFLQPHGITPAYAVRIYRAYGSQALNVVRENPYRLAMDIHGIGFVTADAAAAKLGFEADNPLRIQAGTLYILQKATDDGNVYLPEHKLVRDVCAQLSVEPEQARDAIAALEQDERLVREAMDAPEDSEGQDGADDFDAGDDVEVGVYLRRYHHCESKTAFYLQRLLHSPKAVRFENPDALVDKVTAELPIALAPEQLEAVRTAARSKVMVLTGGPGTGKTTILNAIIQVFAENKAKILLAAPTGRAAKRMSEAIGREARTIHRLLEYTPKDDGFARNEDNPLACGLLVVDEASMMDTMLAYHLLKAAPLGATIVFVGDVHQLPSVGPGNVLGDLIASGAMPVVELVEVFRQAAESEIVCNAHLINRGELPRLESSKDRLSDFYFMRQDDPDRAADIIVDLVKNHIPRRFQLDPFDEIQVLSPMHKGTVGAANLNLRLQQALNPEGEALQRGERFYRLGDKVMQIRNNYEKDVYNGDIGRVSSVDVQEKCLVVRYDDRYVGYDWEELDEIVAAYAISIHKSQGSEYPAVVIPLMTQHYMLLQRNLIYTGVTRGKRLVVLVGEPRALAMAVKNNRMQKRYTWLARRLGAAPEAAGPQTEGERT